MNTTNGLICPEVQRPIQYSLILNPQSRFCFNEAYLYALLIIKSTSIGQSSIESVFKLDLYLRRRPRLEARPTHELFHDINKHGQVQASRFKPIFSLPQSGDHKDIQCFVAWPICKCYRELQRLNITRAKIARMPSSGRDGECPDSPKASQTKELLKRHKEQLEEKQFSLFQAEAINRTCANNSREIGIAKFYNTRNS